MGYKGGTSQADADPGEDCRSEKFQLFHGIPLSEAKYKLPKAAEVILLPLYLRQENLSKESVQ